MNQTKFLELIRGYPSLSEKDLEEIDEVIAAYPYVQIGHALSAKVNQNIHSPQAGIKLKYAAVYTAERAVLKSLLENKISLEAGEDSSQPRGRPEQETAPQTPQESAKTTHTKEEGPAIDQPEASDRERAEHRKMIAGIRSEMEANLQELQKYKFKFFEQNSELFEEELKKKKPTEQELSQPTADGQSPEPGSESDLSSKAKPEEIQPTQPVPENGPSPESIEGGPEDDHSKQSIEEEPEAIPSPELSSQDTQSPASKDDHSREPSGEEPKDIPAPEPDLKGNVTPQPGHPEDTAEQAKDLEESGADNPSDSELQDQIKIIDEFIEASSKLANLPPPEDDVKKEDLSKPSTTFGDDLVSENLANIMIKQGKVNDAIDIYKKLIWKFPQKQAYFAARIEELKKD